MSFILNAAVSFITPVRQEYLSWEQRRAWEAAAVLAGQFCWQRTSIIHCDFRRVLKQDEPTREANQDQRSPTCHSKLSHPQLCINTDTKQTG